MSGRLLRADLIKIWKVFHCRIDVGLPSLLARSTNHVTRGHRFKLLVRRANTDVLRRSWSFRCVNAWNSLPAVVVECGSIATFKRLLTLELGERLFKPFIQRYVFSGLEALTFLCFVLVVLHILSCSFCLFKYGFLLMMWFRRSCVESLLSTLRGGGSRCSMRSCLDCSLAAAM